VVFSDYQCPYCALLAAVLKQIRLTHPDDVRLVYVNTPLSSRDKDVLATQGSRISRLARKNSGKMHDLLFDKEAEWSALAPTDFPRWAVQQAGRSLEWIKPNSSRILMARLLQTVFSKLFNPQAKQPFTPPIMFVTGLLLIPGWSILPVFDMVVRMEALTVRQFSTCPPGLSIRSNNILPRSIHPKVMLLSSFCLIRLPWLLIILSAWPAAAGMMGITFYKMLPDSLVMTGDPSETGLGNTGYPVSNRNLP